MKYFVSEVCAGKVTKLADQIIYSAEMFLYQHLLTCCFIGLIASHYKNYLL